MCLENRYILAFTPMDKYRLGSQIPLEKLSWISFQTRTIDIPPISGLKEQKYKSHGSSLLQDKVKLVQVKNDRNIYFADKYPLQLELLFTEETSDYSHNGSVQSCLETFNCVLKITL